MKKILIVFGIILCSFSIIYAQEKNTISDIHNNSLIDEVLLSVSDKSVHTFEAMWSKYLYASSGNETRVREDSLLKEYHFQYLTIKVYHKEKETEYCTALIIGKYDEIIYYEISRSSDIIIDKYISDNFSVLLDEYAQYYYEPLEMSAIVNTFPLIYGFECGFAGEMLEIRKALNELVKYKNISTLNQWLSTPSSSYKVYAIDGLKQLEKVGLPLEPKQLQIINDLKSSKIKIDVCNGCIGYFEEVGALIKICVNKDFNFIIIKRLLFYHFRLVDVPLPTKCRYVFKSNEKLFIKKGK